LFLSELRRKKASEQPGELSVSEAVCGLFGDRKEFKTPKNVAKLFVRYLFSPNAAKTSAKRSATAWSEPPGILAKFVSFY